MERSRWPRGDEFMKWVEHLLCIGFGLVFVWASVDKILYPLRFALMVDGYVFVPDVFVVPIARILPWIEIVAGVALIFNVFKTGGLFILQGLILLFIIALGINLASGVNAACGCFSTDAAVSKTMQEAMIFDIALFLLGGVLIWRDLLQHKKKAVK